MLRSALVLVLAGCAGAAALDDGTHMTAPEMHTLAPRDSGSCTSILNSLSPPEIPLALATWTSTAWASATDSCNLPTPDDQALKAEFTSYESAAASWVAANSAKLESLVSACSDVAEFASALNMDASNSNLCSTLFGDVKSFLLGGSTTTTTNTATNTDTKGGPEATPTSATSSGSVTSASSASSASSATSSTSSPSSSFVSVNAARETGVIMAAVAIAAAVVVAL